MFCTEFNFGNDYANAISMMSLVLRTQCTAMQ